MSEILTLLGLVASLVPEVQEALPAFQSLIGGGTATASEMVQVWTAIAALEAKVTARAAQIVPPAPSVEAEVPPAAPVE